MAVIDLKNCNIYLVDGYTGNGGGWLVNNGGGYPSTTVTMTVDGGTGSLNDGDQFTVFGESPATTHTITAHTETGPNTTSITFTPALAGSVSDDAAITVLAHKLKIKIGDGNLTYDEKRKIKYVLDRGILDSVKLEDQEPFDVNIDFMWELLRADGSVTFVPTFEEALKQVGNAADWVSSAPDPCQPYCVDIEIDNIIPCPGVKGEKYLLQQFRWESLKHDPKTSLVSATGKCNELFAFITRVTF